MTYKHVSSSATWVWFVIYFAFLVTETVIIVDASQLTSLVGTRNEIVLKDITRVKIKLDMEWYILCLY